MPVDNVSSTDEQYTKLLDLLRKSYLIVTKCASEWKSLLDDTKEILNVLENYLDQYSCCFHLPDESIHNVLTVFPEVKEKLLYKIQLDIERHLSKLSQTVQKLEEICEQICKSVKRTHNKYQGIKKMDVRKITESTATRPSIANMMEWLNDMEQIMYTRCCAKNYSLTMFDVKNEATHPSKSVIWTRNDQDVVEFVEDKLKYVSFFMEEECS